MGRLTSAVGAGPRLGSNSQAMLFFLRHVRYCNLTAIFMPRAYSAESVTGVLDWDHDRAGGIDGDLTVGLHLGGDIVRYGEQRVDDLVFGHGLDDLALMKIWPLPLPEARRGRLRVPRPDR